MSPKDHISGSPEDWFNIALSDFDLAKSGRKGNIRYEELCFHAQQTVEKCIKSVLIKNQIEFPKTHNIQVLLELLPAYLAEPILDSTKLTVYAHTSRYPGDHSAIDKEEWQDAVKIADRVLKWAREIISKIS